EIVFESEISEQWPPYLADHRVYGTAVFPAAAYLEMAQAAAMAVFGSGRHTVENLTIQQALPLPAGQTVTLQCVLSGRDQNPVAFQVYSLASDRDEDDSAWTLHASGDLRPAEGTPPAGSMLLAEIRERCRQEVAVGSTYEAFAALGI